MRTIDFALSVDLNNHAQGIFIVKPSLQGWQTKAKEAPSPHEVKLALLNTNLVFQSLARKTYLKT